MATGSGTKFRVFVAWDKYGCILTCDSTTSAELLRDYLAERFPTSRISGPHPTDDAPFVKVRIEFDASATPFSVRQAVLQHPSAVAPGFYPVPVSDQPHFRVSSRSLATWLEGQGPEQWWTADGDPILMSRLEFPAPADELASELRKLDRLLLAVDPAGHAAGDELETKEIDRAVTVDDWGNRFLTLCWDGTLIEWQLIEDEPTSESNSD